MDLTALEQFQVGNIVYVVDSTIFTGLNTRGVQGCVQKIDYKAGVCVRLFFSRAFEPCFWFQPGSLARSNDVRAFEPLDWKSIESLLGGGPGQVTIPKNSLTIGALRSWLISKSGSKPGQSLFQFISKMSWDECIVVYQGGENVFALWLKVNDTRVRRPSMTLGGDTNWVLKGTPSARRPKIG